MLNSKKFLGRIVGAYMAEGDDDEAVKAAAAQAGGAGGGGIINPGAADDEAVKAAAAAAAGGDQTWIDKLGLSDEYKKDEVLNRFKTPEDFIKSFKEGQKMISGSVRIPNDESTPEEVAAFYAKLGVPAKEDEYTFELTEELKAAGMEIQDEALLTEFKKYAKANNLSQSAANAALNFYAELRYKEVAGSQSNNSKELADNVAALQNEWRGNYQNNIDRINNNLSKVLSKESIAILDKAGAFGKASVIKDLLGLTNMVTGDTLYIDGQQIKDVANTLSAKISRRDALLREKDGLKIHKNELAQLNNEIVELRSRQSAQHGRR